MQYSNRHNFHSRNTLTKQNKLWNIYSLRNYVSKFITKHAWHLCTTTCKRRGLSANSSGQHCAKSNQTQCFSKMSNKAQRTLILFQRSRLICSKSPFSMMWCTFIWYYLWDNYEQLSTQQSITVMHEMRSDNNNLRTPLQWILLLNKWALDHTSLSFTMWNLVWYT